MKSLVKTKSMFGSVPDIFTRKIKKWKSNRLNKNLKFLIVDDKDGHLGLYPLCLSFDVTIVEPNKTFIEGGKIEVPVNVAKTDEYIYINKTSIGIIDRAKIELKEEKLHIINKNFYTFNILDEYDYVCACRSLNRDENKNISMKDKITKLKNAVNDGGYLYIEYYIAIKDNDYKNYPSNQYLRKDEIIKYFDPYYWTIISNEVKIIEDELTPLNRENKDVIIGYLDVRKKPTVIHRKKKKAKSKKMDYYTNREINCIHNYIINGVVR